MSPGGKDGSVDRLNRLRGEAEDIASYSKEELVRIICDVGFSCDGCGRCCTSSYNGHVFLLDADLSVVRGIDRAALIPAPDFEYGDQFGTLYVSGYALRVRDDGSCWFLTPDKRCSIYDRRFSICRIYPYMLHREPDEYGVVDWRQVSGLGDHGEYHLPIDEGAARIIAEEVISYEIAFVRQQIGFWEEITRYFEEHNLRHVRKTYDAALRRFRKGEPVRVMVYADGELKEHTVTADEYRGLML
jgi:hypothetical protein